MFKLIIAIWFIFHSSNCNEITKVRSDFHEINSKEQLYEFIEFIESNYCMESEPYLASAIMRKAEYTFFPNKKLKYFKTGKNKLESFIKDNPDNVEAKYMRFVIQSTIPSFLNYNDHIETDFAEINNNLEYSQLPEDYKHLIQLHINKLKP